jgi:cytochrome c5
MSSRDAIVGAALVLALGACDRGRPPPVAAHDAPPPAPDAALLARAGALENQALDSLPPGPGRDVLLRACTSCHAVPLVTQQRKTPEEWAKTVDKMVGWGAPLRPEDREALLAYLSSSTRATDPGQLQVVSPQSTSIHRL